MENVVLMAEGIYLLPSILKSGHIARILASKGFSHHDDNGHGHGGGHLGTGLKEDDTSFRAKKPYHLPDVASVIYQCLPDIKTEKMCMSGVDENMQMYRLCQGVGAVSRHVDEDFKGNGNQVALWSILVYLNGNYSGGETVFWREKVAPHLRPGGGILFRHDIPHEGLVVTRGEKYVLKTDLFFH